MNCLIPLALAATTICQDHITEVRQDMHNDRNCIVTYVNPVNGWEKQAHAGKDCTLLRAQMLANTYRLLPEEEEKPDYSFEGNI